MFDYKIDTELLPNVYVTWTSTKNGRFNKRYWLNCATGEKKETAEEWMYYPNEGAISSYGWQTDNHIGIGYRTVNNPAVWVKSGTNVKYAYVKYHKDIDMLEIAAVGVDTTRKPGKHEWTYLGDRFFIDRDKKIVNQDGRSGYRYYIDDTHYAYNGKCLIGIISRMNHRESALNEFKKFIGNEYFTIGNGSCVTITSFWHIQRWYETTQKSRGKGKEQALADMLTSISLSDASSFGEKYPVIEVSVNGRYSRRIRGVTYFERVNDDWSVLRIFNRNDDNTLVEMNRLYVHNNGRLRYVSLGPTGWIPANITRFGYGQYSNFVNLDEASEKCSVVKYAAEAVHGVDPEDFVDRLITTLRFPEIEQMAKLGCKRVANYMMSDLRPKARLKSWLGDYYNEKEKNILRKIGLTKQQLDCYVEQHNNETAYGNYTTRGLREMRRLFGNDLRHIDIESFKKYLKGLSDIEHHFWYSVSSAVEDFHLDGVRFIKNLIRLGEKNAQIYSTVNDAMNVAKRLRHGTRPEIDWYFDSFSDALRVHDALVEIKNRQDAEQRALRDMELAERLKKEEEKRLKVDKERKKYEYEDDKYIIRLPKDSNEIVREGSVQRICIGGYTSRHALGETNLFFLRDKNNPEVPFYAIEMNHDNIVQIHGYCNKWLGNNPDAIPTVIRWLRQHGISCSNEILTCKSTGYGRTREYVAMPVVD